MNILDVFSHARRDSSSGGLLDSFVASLAEAGPKFEIADLHGESFDSVMPVADQPDWNRDDKRDSDATLKEQTRITRHDALAFVFPLWWWSTPAMLKGRIDRVWANGWAYGSRKLPDRQAMLLATASGALEGHRKRGYEQAMDAQLIVGTMNYCGIADDSMQVLYDVMAGPLPRRRQLTEARELGRHFLDGLGLELQA